MPICDTCNIETDAFELFRKTCRNCRNIYKIKMTRTKEGHIKKMYLNQQKSSQKRGHIRPQYNYEQLKNWILDKELFHELYEKWVESDYSKWLAPSTDRIDNSKGYSFDNVRLVTFKENSDRAHADCKKGIISSGHKNIFVSQYTLDGKLLNTYPTIREADRSVGGNCRKEIKKCCEGFKTHARGFAWRYANGS